MTSPRPFVGRARELEELGASLDAVAAGRGRLELVTGEPGIGKTRLLQELAGAAADRGWEVLTGRCWEGGGAPAYWPWIQVVRAAGGELERLAETTSASAVDPESARFGLFDAVTQFLAGAAHDQPLVIVLEDLHAADEPSLLLLRFLGDAVAEHRMLVVGSYREDERRVRDLAPLFAELVRVGRRLPLRGLTVDEVEAYLGTSRGTAEHLHAMTQGNPFFLGELAKLPADGDTLLVPREVRALIRRRLADLSPPAMSALRTAAVIGREVDVRVLERTSPESLGDLLDVLAETVDAGVLRSEAPGRYSFAHELLRETLYVDMPPSRRAELHLAVGRGLEELNRADLDPYFSEIAHHLARAAPLGDPAEAVGYLMRASDRAFGLLAYEEAVLHTRRALELLGPAPGERRCELLLRLGDAQWRAGDVLAARSSFEAAAELARRTGAGELLALAALGYVIALGGFLMFARFEAGATGVGLLEEALAALPGGDSPLRARLLAHLAVEMYSANEPVERRVAVSDEAIEMARRVDDPDALVAALRARSWVLVSPELMRARLAHTEEMLAASDEREARFLAHNARFHCFLELGERRPMDTEIEAMAEIAQLARLTYFEWHVICMRTIRAIIDGRFEDAERLAAEAHQLGRLRHSGYAYVHRYAQLFATRWAQGRAHELRDINEGHGDRFPWVARWRDALVAAELGDAKAARAEVERYAGHDFADLPRDGLWILLLCSLAEACVLLGDKRRGERLYELLLPHADRIAVAYTQVPFGPVALRLGMLAAMFGRRAEAEHHFASALRRCDALGARAVRARVLYEHARTLLADDGARATAMLDEAARLCDELGMTGIRVRVAALARERPPAPAVDAVFRREGEFWTIAYDGSTSQLRDVKGLRYLAFLLGAPLREVHVLELARAAEGLEPRNGRRAHELPTAGSDGPAVLDDAAKTAYRTRLRELGEGLQQARDWNDPERVAAIEEEIDALTTELARAAGLGGRDRRLPSEAERARVSVTKAIRTAIRMIERQDAALGGHLAESVHTGRLCSYAPPGESPPRWEL